jgi:hypothetical protein
MAKFDAKAILKPDWGIIDGRFEQKLELHGTSLAECARSTHV